MFYLYILPKGEALKWEKQESIQLNHFGIVSRYTSLFKENFGEFSMDLLQNPDYKLGKNIFAQTADELFESLNDDQKSLIPQTSTMWTARYKDQIEKDASSFFKLVEILAMNQAVQSWLTPDPEATNKNRLWPRQLFIANTLQNPDEDLDVSIIKKGIASEDLKKFSDICLAQYMEEAFRYRTSDVGLQLNVIEIDGKRNFTHVFSSKSLASLAWIEIMWGIDHDVYAHTCEVCGGVFELTNPYKREVFTCSYACRRKRKAEIMGGIEALRQYNKEAQQRSRSNRKNL